MGIGLLAQMDENCNGLRAAASVVHWYARS